MSKKKKPVLVVIKIWSIGTNLQYLSIAKKRLGNVCGKKIDLWKKKLDIASVWNSNMIHVTV